MAGQTLTPKQEKFAQAYVETGNASEAYRRAYDASKSKPDSINVNASKLCADAKVAQRIAELQAEAKKRHEITVDTIRDMLLEDREFARQLETPAAAVSATEKLGKLYGHFTERTESTVKASVVHKIILEGVKP